MIGQNAPVAEPVPSGFKQDHLHRPACNEILRPIIAGIDTPFFLTNLLNVTVRVDQFAGLDADFLLLLSKALLHQLAHRAGQYFDANAEGPNFRHRNTLNSIPALSRLSAAADPPIPPPAIKTCMAMSLRVSSV